MSPLPLLLLAWAAAAAPERTPEDCIKEFEGRLPEDEVARECARGEEGRQALLARLSGVQPLPVPPVQDEPAPGTAGRSEEVVGGIVETVGRGVQSDVASLYGERTANASGVPAVLTGGGTRAPVPPANTGNGETGLRTRAVPEERVARDGDPGHAADWMAANEDALLRCPEGMGWWACSGHRNDVAHTYFNYRSAQCDEGGGSWYACLYYRTRRFTTGGGKILSDDPVEFAKLMTPVGSGESLYETAAGEKDADALDVSLDAAGMIPVVGGIFKIGRLGRLGKVAKVIGRGSTAVNITEDALALARRLRLKGPAESCRLSGAAILPGQGIASPQIVAEYSLRMKAGLWDWAKGEKIVLGVGRNGERVIIEGHHRYMAAKLSGVDIPASAFQTTSRPWVADSWARMAWSSSN